MRVESARIELIHHSADKLCGGKHTQGLLAGLLSDNGSRCRMYPLSIGVDSPLPLLARNKARLAATSSTINGVVITLTDGVRDQFIVVKDVHETRLETVDTFTCGGRTLLVNDEQEQ